MDKTDFELYSLAVSAINGCGACMAAHERVVRKAGLGAEAFKAPCGSPRCCTAWPLRSKVAGAGRLGEASGLNGWHRPAAGQSEKMPLIPACRGQHVEHTIGRHAHWQRA